MSEPPYLMLGAVFLQLYLYRSYPHQQQYNSNINTIKLSRKEEKKMDRQFILLSLSLEKLILASS